MFDPHVHFVTTIITFLVPEKKRERERDGFCDVFITHSAESPHLHSQWLDESPW